MNLILYNEPGPRDAPLLDTLAVLSSTDFYLYKVIEYFFRGRSEHAVKGFEFVTQITSVKTTLCFVQS